MLTAKVHTVKYHLWSYLRSHQNTFRSLSPASYMQLNRSSQKTNTEKKDGTFRLISNTSDMCIRQRFKWMALWNDVTSKFSHFFLPPPLDLVFFHTQHTAHTDFFLRLFVSSAHPHALLFNVMLFYYMNKNCMGCSKEVDDASICALLPHSVYLCVACVLSGRLENVKFYVMTMK